MPGYQEESFLGSGDLQIAIYDLATGALLGERDVGNASQFVINAPTLEKKELIGYRRANYAQTIKSVNTKNEQEFSFTLTDINRKNLALAMFGTDGDFTQAAGNNTATPETVVARHNAWVKLAGRNLDSSDGNKPVVTNAAGGTTYEEGTDYEIDYQVGRIYVFSTGTILDAASIKVASKWLAVSGFNVVANTNNKFEAFLRLIGRDQANNRDCEVIIHKGELSPSGDVSWLTDDFASLEFKGKILATADGTWEVIFY